jgi:hypothetical protein
MGLFPQSLTGCTAVGLKRWSIWEGLCGKKEKNKSNNICGTEVGLFNLS